MNRRVAAVIAAALIPLALLGVAIIRRDGGKHAPARLPIVLSGRTAEPGAGGVTDAALAPFGVIVYHPGNGLPALDGTARAYRVAAPDTAGAARRIASALDLHGEPAPDSNGAFSLTDGAAQLTVTARDWSFARDPNASVSSGVAAACPQDAPTCAPDDVPPVPTRPADLPSQDAAKAAALALLERAGVDTTGADVSVDDGITQWYVSVDPVVDGIATQGFGYSVVVGDKGAIESANGILGTATPADEYPLIGTSAAIDRLNAGEGSVGPQPLEATGAVASDVAAPPDAGSVEPAEPSAAPIPELPPESAPPPESEPPVTDTIPTPSPQDITLTGAERILLYATSADGTEGWLVPAYRLSTSDGVGPTVIAVDDEFLAPATVTKGGR